MPPLSGITPKRIPEKCPSFVRSFLKRVLNTVAQYQLWNSKDSFIIAVSGGPDSLCLLDVLYLLSQKLHFSLHVAHVNYRLRGNDSELDEALVRERVALYDLPLSVLHPKITHSTNLEEKLRDIRYRFFEKVRLEQNATLIAVAHHEDDQAETFLLRLLRGSGTLGLSSMQPKRDRVVRPLLKQSRADILRYLNERGIPYRTDQSNSDPTFLRNRIRHELIPLLSRNYQPNITSTLAQTASLLAADSTFIEEIAAHHSRTLLQGTSISVTTLLKFPETLLTHMWRDLIKKETGEFPSRGIITEIIKVLKSPKGKTQKVTFQGLKIVRKGDTVTLLHF